MSDTALDRVKHRLTNWKRQLIDLTRRNRLLNYRPTKASTVEIVDEIPQRIFRHLLAGDAFTFDPRPEPSEAELKLNISNDSQPRRRVLRTGQALEHVTDEELEDHHLDDRLQTTLPEARLRRNLLSIYRRATESLEEQGISTLFLALGLLEWHEAEQSEIVSKAPILMVPVQLRRATAASPFVLHLGDGDPLVNPALVEKLRLDFNITLPDVAEMSDDIDVDQLFRDVQSAVHGFDRWRLTADVVLGLFSFQKFIMYRDIERNEERFRSHPVISAVCREGEQAGVTGLPRAVAEADLDEEMSPWSSIQVLDADSSQQRMMFAVKRGHNLVVEGPPGTGKSQSITNVIADALHDDKTVLFVSEKMAALEVVKSRLEHDAGLGSYVLELHSNKTSKRRFVEELSRSLDLLPESIEEDYDQSLRRLQQLATELRDYVVSLHTPFPPLNWSPYQAIGALAEVEDQPRVDAPNSEVIETSADELADALGHLDELSHALSEIGSPASHPLRGLGLEFAGRRERSRLESVIAEAGRCWAEFIEATHEVAKLAGLRTAQTLGDADVILGAAETIAASPGAELSVLENPSWNQLSTHVEELLEVGMRYSNRRSSVKSKFKAEVLDTDIKPTVDRYTRHLERGIGRLFFPSYWRARSELRGFLRADHRPGAKELGADARLAQACREDRTWIDGRNETGRSLFGSRWNGPQSDWGDLRAFAEWVVNFRQYAMQDVLRERGLSLVADRGIDASVAARVIDTAREARRNATAAIQELIDAGDFSPESGIDLALDASIASIAQRLAKIEANIDELRPYSAFVAARNACRENLLSEYVTTAIELDLEPDQITPAFRRHFFEHWLEHVCKARPVLDRFRAPQHEERIQAFQDLDRRSLQIARVRAQKALQRKRQELLGAELQDQLQVLQYESRKRRRILPIRKLFQRAGGAIQCIKPCFMMSPLSVAQYLDPEAMQFDVLIFDEASQIPPSDAIGSMIRADQVVVVGDSKQLPPTNFFGVHLDDVAIDEDDEIDMLEDLESILDEVAVSGIPSVRLKWHYRSQHQSLIRFSNEEFYSDDPLYVFPSALRDSDDLGLKFEFVEDGVYTGRGENPIEATRVAEAVAKHIHDHPTLSLGVGTFGVAQQSRILDEIDQLRREDPSIEWFFAQDGEQKFFVKNLENIQGDDRDVIFLSVTYGPDENGVVRRNFGPINKRGGWRRLNVLTTRAKRCLRVFSSMRADQIDINGLSEGARLLHRYLRYAETGEYPSSNLSSGVPDSPFERAVINALESRGYRVIPQVGDAGYRIDIGVLDTDFPGQYICGIECDGASYHSAATVRDRDRLRQEVLEKRGWIIHRVWSTDWFHDPGRQVERLVELIEESRERIRAGEAPLGAAEQRKISRVDQSGPAPGIDTDVNEQRNPNRTPLDDIVVPSYNFTPVQVEGNPDEFYTAAQASIARIVIRVLEVEGPIHIKELSRRTAAFWGMQRAGSQIVQRVKRTLERLVESGDVVEEGEFYWLTTHESSPVRSRAVEGVTFQSDLVAPVEILQAIRLLLRHRAPLLPRDLVTETARLLGFSRTGRKLRQRIENAYQQLVENGEIRAGGRGLHLAES